ncbi:DUF803 domain membrane protein [Paecilomyces variotii No. 5]|uniref:DUF803 domain membrane protein n=1 Tax=Byssochlamys spectabilis (strain No. 5 / NBRC 109023) TaxID=1356009 RepID=V5FJI5_BYSSN|nr:DUF803 domain membrane protein [Paecilomyces variotii No. 5]
MEGSRDTTAAGLLSTTVPSAVPQLTSTPSAFQALLMLGSDGSGGMRSWSTLIGIVTALVGNILISFALNIQRYAHIRIEREWENERVRLGVRRRPRWTQSSSNERSSHNYGTVSDSIGQHGEDEQDGREYADSPTFERYRDDLEDLHSEDGEEHDEHGRLGRSFQSDRTLRPVEKDTNGSDRKSYLKSPYWWAGIVLMTIGEAGNFLAYGFAPASIVSPLGVIALVSNCVIAPFMLKEKFRKRDFWGVVVAIAGAVVVVLSASSSEEKIGPHEIWDMITTWEFELYLGLTASMIVVLMWSSAKYGSRTLLIDLGLVGLFGGYTALSTKGVASLLSFTLWHVITFPITYLLVAVLVFSALMQIRYLNRALQRFDSTQVIPTQFVLFTLSVIIGSAVLYRDFESTTASRAAKFVGGCALTFLGVYLITSGRVSADDDSSSIEDEEEAIGFMHGERYQDEIDVSASGPDRQVRKPGQTATGEQAIPHSPGGSLSSDSINMNDDELVPPRPGLSQSLSSQTPSLTAASLTSPSRDGTVSPEPPHSLINNPWASDAHSVDTSQSEPAERPSTPPETSAESLTESTVALRFPSAPGMVGQPSSGTPQVPSTPSAVVDRTHRRPRHPPGMRTPPASSRHSLSLRLTPGPLLPPLSSGLSAVVAESLRRGEGSPGKTQRAKRQGRTRKHSSAAFEAVHRDREAGETEYDTEASVDYSSGAIQSTPASTRFNSTGDIHTDEVSSPANGDTDTKDLADGASSSRLRSLSDSWNGRLAWLGGTLRKPNKGKPRTLLPSAPLDRENNERAETGRE